MLVKSKHEQTGTAPKGSRFGDSRNNSRIERESERIQDRVGEFA